MKGDLHKKVKPEGTLTEIVNAGRDGLKHLNMHLINLMQNEEISVSSGEYEQALIILTGTCKFTTGNIKVDALGVRKSVLTVRRKPVMFHPVQSSKLKR